MTLFFIGIGLSDEKDITLKGLEAIKKSRYVFLENYTSILNCSYTDLEKFYCKKIILADRDMVENRANEILDKSITDNVSFLVVGDVFSATTHIDLFMRAKKSGINVIVINNAGIFNAIGLTGLQLYKFGKITSIPFVSDNYIPETAYDVIYNNKKIGLHTLVLLDLDTKNFKFMTPNDAFRILLEIELKRKKKLINHNTGVVVCSRMGKDDSIVYDKIANLLDYDFGKPLHSIIFPGKLHFMEEEVLEYYRAKK
ncbi:MAG: diphthine synthase [Candidatus Woesearchaeota archaeon]